MITKRAAGDRGHADHGWLKTAHSFSFADYQDPKHVRFGPLRVINDDWIAAGSGFGKHGHRDMEIITYVLEGALAHEDSMGNRATIVPGEVQRMSAGSGVLHSEFNHAAGPTRLLQIWIMPDRASVTPSYEQKMFDAADKRGKLKLVVSPDGHDGSVKIYQDARIYASLIDGQETLSLALESGRLGYVHVAEGRCTINNHALERGDALRFKDEPLITIEHGEKAEILVFDLPPFA